MACERSPVRARSGPQLFFELVDDSIELYVIRVGTCLIAAILYLLAKTRKRHAPHNNYVLGI